MLRVVLGLACALVLAFLALGVVFRAPGIGILTDDVVADLRPALEFGLGWLGFVVGMQFDVREMDRLPDKTGAVVFFETAVPLVAAAGACALALWALGSPWSLRDA